MCCQKRRQEKRWRFKNGSCVIADTFENAVAKLNAATTSKCRVFEIEPGEWEVQFEKSVAVELQAESSFDASSHARWNLYLDKRDAESPAMYYYK